MSEGGCGSDIGVFPLWMFPWNSPNSTQSYLLFDLNVDLNQRPGARSDLLLASEGDLFSDVGSPGGRPEMATSQLL